MSNNHSISDHRDDSDAGLEPEHAETWVERVAYTPHHRDCMPPESYWYAGRKVNFRWSGRLPEELWDMGMDLLYEGKLGEFELDYEGEKVLIRISE